MSVSLELPPSLLEERETVTIVEVPPAEWAARLSHIEPFKTHGFPNPALCKVLCAVAPNEEVVAAWWITLAWHAEPVWIAPEHRKRPGLIRRLWERVRQELIAEGADVAFGIITDPQVVGQASRLGFARVHGDLYFLRVNKDEEKES